MRTRVKVCGIRREEDARMVEELGVDAIGLIFAEESPRRIDTDSARLIQESIGPFVTRVGLFVNPSAEFVKEVLSQVKLQLLQFHGDEDNNFCDQFGIPYIKALRFRDRDSFIKDTLRYPSAAGLLVDSYRAGQYGGTGETFAWDQLPAIDKPLILAGGLNPTNITEAVLQVKPYGVDVSSGLESKPGAKDAGKMRAFLDRISAADLQIYE